MANNSMILFQSKDMSAYDEQTLSLVASRNHARNIPGIAMTLDDSIPAYRGSVTNCVSPRDQELPDITKKSFT
jgi:hypothetical protein